jgi:LmbE family N-acetylglucosaminyl deacetylase
VSEFIRALVVTAHPDDVDFGAAGTVATLVRDGVDVTYCIITDGDAGGFDPSIARSEIPRIRHEEQRAAAAVLGVTDVRFLGYRDGELTVSHELRRDISRVIRQVRPQRVITQSPDRNWNRVQASHPDHLAAGEATMAAVYPDARNPFAHMSLLDDEGLDAWTVPEVWLMASPTLTTYVDVTDVFELKLRAIGAHVSQLPDPVEVEARVRAWTSDNAKNAGLGADRFAEAFQVVPTA